MNQVESSENNVKVQISEKAVAFIKSKRLADPMVLVSIGSRLSGGDGCGCGGDPDKSHPGNTEEFLTTFLLDGGKPGGIFTRVDTDSGIPVYLTDRVYVAARKGKNTLIVTVKGLVMKKLAIEGLDTVMLINQRSERKSKIH